MSFTPNPVVLGQQSLWQSVSGPLGASASPSCPKLGCVGALGAWCGVSCAQLCRQARTELRVLTAGLLFRR